MPFRKTQILFLLVLLLIALPVTLAQPMILKDKAIMQSTQLAVQKLYNYEFAEAEALLPELERKTPGHPLVPLLKALIIYQREYPLPVRSSVAPDFEKLCIEAIRRAETLHHKKQAKTEAIAFEMLSRALLNMYYVDNGEYMSVAGGAPALYRQVSNGFSRLNEFDEFYFTTGLYNYYRVAYPEAHPIYKPVAALFPQGSKITGLQQLMYAADHCIFLRAEALLFLSLIYNNYEQSPLMGVMYAQKLQTLFPGNQYFRAEYIEALLINRQDQTAREQTEILLRNPARSYISLRALTFQGILFDRLDKKPQLARKSLEEALGMTQEFGKAGTSTMCLLNFALSRVYRQLGETKKAEAAYKTAKTLSVYPWEADFARD